jgi:hypothetical protein
MKTLIGRRSPKALALRFLPAEHDGIAIEHVAILPVNFKLPKSN